MKNEFGSVLKKEYGFDFPEDFWKFYEFSEELIHMGLGSYLWDYLGICTAGPYDVLDGHFDNKEIKLPWYLHYRYVMDPPEFFTIFTGDCDGLHYGYWIDDDKKGVSCIAAYYNNDAYEIWQEGNTTFDVIRKTIEKKYNYNVEALEWDEDQEDYYLDENKKLEDLRKVLFKYATKERTEIGKDYVDKYKVTSRQPIIATRDGMGIVSDPASYRKVSYDMDLISKTDKEDLVKEAEKALQDGFPASALKIGKDLWSAGGTFLPETYDILEKAYKKLDRHLLRKVLLSHKEYRDNTNVDITRFKGKSAQSIDNYLGEPEEVVILALSSKNLKELSSKIDQFKNVEEINLSYNQLEKLPPEIGELNKLKILRISANKLTSLPKEIGKLSNLKSLYLENNQIAFLPDEIKNLKSLKILNLEGNSVDNNYLKKLKEKIPNCEILI